MNSTAEMEDDDKFNETYDFSYFKSVFYNTGTTEISKVLSSENKLSTPLWFQIMDILALTILSCGFVANLCTIYIVSGGSKLFTAAVRILLRYQAGIDAFCSVCAIILIVQPPFWLTGWAHWFDTIICHLWHAQFIYWSAMFISIWNLMFVAVERYIAVCHPFKHALIKNSHVRKCILSLYIMNIVLHWGYIQVHMEGDKCTLGFWIQGEIGEKMFKSFVVMAFLLYYAIPVLTFIICYGMIIFTMKRRQSQEEMGTHSRLIDSATKQLIKTAITVTVVFMLSLGYEVWTFFLGNLGLVSFYTKYQHIQKVGIWIAALNPTANPFAYFVLIPKYRHKVLRTFLPCLAPDRKGSTGDSFSGTTIAVTEMTKVPP